MVPQHPGTSICRREQTRTPRAAASYLRVLLIFGSDGLANNSVTSKPGATGRLHSTRIAASMLSRLCPSGLEAFVFILQLQLRISHRHIAAFI